ncbi:MAG: polysaccharide export protein [Gammaproteobacteria bacterium]|nr:polysaccharide export protein [Gammaproteobacteria bacterium]
MFTASLLRRSRHCAVGLLLVLFATGVSAADTTAVRDPYLINPGDILTISVWKEPDLLREVQVNPDGLMSFPLAGDMLAAGRTVSQLQAELTEKLGRLIPDASVSVGTKFLNGNTIYVLGQVNRPNIYQMFRPTDVMQAISMAGGVTSFADLNGIRVLRRDENGKQVSIRFRYDDIRDGDKLAQNIVLRAGDTIVVP